MWSGKWTVSFSDFFRTDLDRFLLHILSTLPTETDESDERWEKSDTKKRWKMRAIVEKRSEEDEKAKQLNISTPEQI